MEMYDDTVTSFQPDWACPPGATIEDFLAERAITENDFCKLLGKSSKQIKDLLTGAAEITEEVADNLSSILGMSKDFWLSREKLYQQGLTRLEDNKQWVASFPTSDMTKLGWLPAVSGLAEKVSACLDFFGVSTVREWFQSNKEEMPLAAFRTSQTFTSDEGAIRAWLRRGEILAEDVSCATWNRNSFHDSLAEIRKLTRVSKPEVFFPKLKNLCAASGVAVVIARAPKGCRASGVTRFIAPNKAMLMLSARHLSDDHFWFTFFHEAGHLVLHDESILFLEGGELCTGLEEEEANAFAEDILIPVEHRSRLKKVLRDHITVMKFAREIGVSPGIVVGQMQHYGYVDPSHMNKLKRRFSWT